MHYLDLLYAHSYYRWIVLLVLLVQFVWIWYKKNSGAVYSKQDFNIHLTFTMLINIQLLLGWGLFLQSPIALGFWNDISLGVKHRQMRFFGLEHMSMMSLGIVLSNLYCCLAYKRIGMTKFDFLWKPYLWIYFILLSSIPWSFSPLTSRPNFR